ncbi:RDD family protein [Streptomyces pseudovenezuelae]|uniref:RDD family membrane protein YckC n=1 Tax=Streptomyces pseudovenezuelae TaxID=67350 RepID=A0ABT6M0N6_9ACTN|nr:RDD family protein [Streptomyces pseudovenezuelae]MDH6221189.1 putative RDD family membrane protein YckC [Streptomyces pseudovenezuelae]
MSAPTPAPGDDRPREGYYPDPSIPGYVRYWNGASWVPGTSRPAPSDGAPLAAPDGSGSAPVEETGPHFFDEDPAPQVSQHGNRPEPASAWGADRSRQAGFGGEQDRRVSWGSPQGPDPRVQPDTPAADPTGHTDGTATVPPADTSSDIPSDGTFVFRRPKAGSGGAGGSAGGVGASGAGRPAAAAGSGIPGPGGPVGDEGTMTFRAMTPRAGQQGAQSGGTGAPGAPGFGAGKAAADRAAAQSGAGAGAGAAGVQGPASAPAALSGPQGPASAPTALSGPQQAAPGVPAQSSGPQPAQPAAAAGQASAAPMSSGSGGGQPSWAQQVHRLAGGEDQPVAPWKPPVEDVFQAAARRQSEARPAPLGKRLAARLLDTVVLAGVTAVAAVPLGTKAIDHVDEKVDAAKLSGETVTVWLLDGTTSVYLGVVLAVLLLFGVLYEALPTAKWGRTLGKKLFGLEVRDIEGHQPPTFGGAVRRWLVYSVPGLLVIGVVGVAWCLFDRPWRQCWHDKAAHTFVAG